MKTEINYWEYLSKLSAGRKAKSAAQKITEAFWAFSKELLPGHNTQRFVLPPIEEKDD